MDKYNKLPISVITIALMIAAEEAYMSCPLKREIRNKEEWVENKIDIWIEKVNEKFPVIFSKDYMDASDQASNLFSNLQLGETKKLNKDTRITRVPGGWVWSSDVQPHSSTFIPFIKGE